MDTDQDFDGTTRTPHVDAARYEEMYAASVSDPEAFWDEAGKRIDWMTPYNTVKNVDFTMGNVSIEWYGDGTLNVCANCVDRHLETRGDQTAIIWEPDDPETPAKHITYKELHVEVCR
ncbi:MAG: acetyl-coenzyme A synthetase N-terminal domain-containing protein, partial [Pseudomonadota bacterium]